jgi:hypothetical protein
LIVGAAARRDVTIAEAHGHIVDELRHLEALELPIASMFRDQRASVRYRISAEYILYVGIFLYFISISPPRRFQRLQPACYTTGPLPFAKELG